jgi:hypothetical protein
MPSSESARWPGLWLEFLNLIVDPRRRDECGTCFAGTAFFKRQILLMQLQLYQPSANSAPP